MGGGADRAWGEDDALSEGGEASSDTWRRGRLMALKTSATMQMTESQKQRGEIKDASKEGRHESRKRTQRRHETLCLLATRACSPRGCRSTAPVLTGAAARRLDWTY